MICFFHIIFIHYYLQNLFIDCIDSHFRRRGLRWHCLGQTATCWCSWLRPVPPPPPPSYWPTPQNNDKQLQTKGRQSDHIDEMIHHIKKTSRDNKLIFKHLKVARHQLHSKFPVLISSSLTNNKDFNWNTIPLNFLKIKYSLNLAFIQSFPN